MLSRKYRNIDFFNMLVNVNAPHTAYMTIDTLWEYAQYFQLDELHEITCKGLLQVLRNHGCIEVIREENLVELDQDSLLDLVLNLASMLGIRM